MENAVKALFCIALTFGGVGTTLGVMGFVTAINSQAINNINNYGPYYTYNDTIETVNETLVHLHETALPDSTYVWFHNFTLESNTTIDTLMIHCNQSGGDIKVCLNLSINGISGRVKVLMNNLPYFVNNWLYIDTPYEIPHSENGTIAQLTIRASGFGGPIDADIILGYETREPTENRTVKHVRLSGVPDNTYASILNITADNDTTIDTLLFHADQLGSGGGDIIFIHLNMSINNVSGFASTLVSQSYSDPDWISMVNPRDIPIANGSIAEILVYNQLGVPIDIDIIIGYTTHS